MRFILHLATSIAWINVACSQYFPPIPQNVTTVKSKFNSGISISYKEVQYGLLCNNQLLIYGTNSSTLAWHLRDYTRSKIVCWLCPSPTWHSCRCQRIPELLDQYFLLVLRVSKRPGKRSSLHMDEWGSRLFVHDRIAHREWSL